VVLRALGGLGAELMRQYPSAWKPRLVDLASINWSKKNREWENVCMVANSVVSNRQARLATKAYLKRKLCLPVSEAEGRSIEHLSNRVEADTGSVAGAANPSTNGTIGTGPSSVDECIQHHRFKTARDAVGKFLFALSWLSKKHGDNFRKVFDIQGRKRRYFAESREAIEESGSSVTPQQIPDTTFWVATNNSTPKKQRMLADVMGVLGYSPGDINRLTDAVGHEELVILEE
jgi:negative regulator of replication initiation